MKQGKKQRPPKNKKVRRKQKVVGPASAPTGPQDPHIQQMVDQALADHSAGRLPEAEALYRQILQRDPNHYVALHLLGVIGYQVGNNDFAVDLISQALAIKPDFAEAHFNLGNALHSLARLDQAITSFQAAITINPGYADAYVNLGNVLKDSGRLKEAAASHRQALAIRADFLEAHINLGNVLQELEQLAEAIASYRQALVIKPDLAGVQCNLGGALQDLGQLDEAIACYHQALAIDPNFADAHYNLGLAFREQGKIDEAFNCQRRATALDPQNPMFWSGLAKSVEKLSFTSVDESLLSDLLQLVDQPTVRPSDLARPIISAITHSLEFLNIAGLSDAAGGAPQIDYWQIAGKLAAIPLLLKIMALSPINELAIERQLAALRATMLEQKIAGPGDDQALPFSAALALHCFTNEYLYPETEAEKAALEQLQGQIAGLLDDGQDVPAYLIVALGAYRPLYYFDWASQLAARQWSGALEQVIKRQILEPLEERTLASGMTKLTAIDDAVSQSVRTQYEENPYPRWIETSIRVKAKPVGAELRGAPFRFDLVDYQEPESPQILVAGCGTGQQALATASRFTNARVLAIDLSLSSLAYASRKTAALGVSNIEYGHGDIMALGDLGRQFDVIESIGVLHHLGNPLAGWRVLTGLLKPGGLMMIGLYSETARQDVLAGRSLIEQMGYAASGDGIRRCRADIIKRAEAGDQRMAELCRRRDFFGLSECRDLLFHVQEHRFTLPGINAALQNLGLSFLGFEMQDQQPLNVFRKSHPDKSALTSLPLWHDFELSHPETFRSMYQFWCQKRA